MPAFRAIDASSVTLYSQVHQRLRERILDDSYAHDTRLPAESEIGAIFGVSRITVLQALGDLQKKGLIVKGPGRGSFVARPRPSQDLSRLEGFGEAMSRKGHRILNRVLSQLELPAPRRGRTRPCAPPAPAPNARRGAAANWPW